MLPPKNAAAAIVESAAALALSVPAPTNFANRPWGLVIAHSLARGEHLRHLLLEKRIAFDIAARPALPGVAETAHPMPDVEKKRSAIPVLRGSTITHPVRGAPSERSHGNPARVCSRRRPVAHVTRGFTSRMKHSIESISCSRLRLPWKLIWKASTPAASR